MSKAVCILGTHRSGTSVVTRIVALLGAFLGEDGELMPAGPANPRGFWERLDVCELHERLLAVLGRRWDTAIPLPLGWEDDPSVEPLRQELLGIVTTRLLPHDPWAWKDPRTTLLLPLWRRVLEELQVDLHCLLVVRHPVNVARSLVARDGFEFAEALGIWFNQTLQAARASEGLPRAAVCYEGLLEDWRGELGRATREMELTLPEPMSTRAGEIGVFLDASLNHGKPAEEHGPAGAPRRVATLYEALERSTKEPGVLGSPAFSELIAELDGDYREVTGLLGHDISLLRSEIDRILARLAGELAEERARSDDRARRLDSTLAELAAMQERVAEHTALIEDTGAELDSARALLESERMRALAFEGDVVAMRRSRSWRLTRPLRAVARRLRALRARLQGIAGA